jgi:phenylpyruvate tautomerase PptA (4-oxalocrotonate tautomerase family)
MPRRNRSFPAQKTKLIRDIVKVTHQSIGSDPKIINVILVERPEANMSISGRIYGEASK